MTIETANQKTATLTSRKAREVARREQEILQAALECFSGENWESVTVAQLADIVGIAKGTMYLHFASKHEIYARLTLDFYQALLKHLLYCATQEADDHLRHLLEQAFLFYLDKPKYRCVTQYCEREDFRRNLNPDIAAEFESIEQSFHQLIRSELTRGLNSGRYKPVPIEQTIIGLQCTFHGALMVLWCNKLKEPDNAREFIRTVTDYMITPLLKSTLGPHCNTTNNSSIPEPVKRRQTLEFSHE